MLTSLPNTEFTPTWLCIKQHNTTGLKYFGQTAKPDPDKYLGSGIYWLRHLASHGSDVTTMWKQLFYDRQSLVEYALTFSKENDIVNSEDWANLIDENGLSGSPKGSPNPRKGKQNANPRSDRWRMLQRESQKGKIRSNVSDATRKVLSEKISGQVWWNNGIVRTKSKECPGEGWHRGLKLA